MKISAVLAGFPLLASATTFSAKLNDVGTHCVLIEEGPAQMHRLAQNGAYVTRMEREDIEFGPDPGKKNVVDDIVEVFASSMEMVRAEAKHVCGKIVDESHKVHLEKSEDKSEVLLYVDGGDPSNRIDVVFMGDGYLASQKDKFYKDMARLTDDMFGDVTFGPWLPVFNIWHIFQPSNVEGVGVYSTPRDTRYGLYRQGTQLRGLFTSKANTARADCRLTGANACDFPSLLGNDPYYGGLGGEFTISTESPTSGTIVLRHEMGHNFINVGEGYDGGQVYRGANFDSSRTNIKWSHWLTDPQTTVPEEQNYLLKQDYAWHDLGEGDYSVRFNSTGQYDRWYLRFTASGVPEEGSFAFTLDGEEMEWSPAGIGFDRGFHDYFVETGGFSQGEHTLVFREGFPAPAGNPIRQLCSMTIHEYKAEPLYHWDNDYIGAYPTFNSASRMVGYRPDNEFGLMRNMSSVYFNKPNEEGMWMQFLMRMQLLDGVSVDSSSSGSYTVTAETVKLGQLRAGGKYYDDERYEVRWYFNGTPQTELDDVFSFETTQTGSWSISLQYLTPQVRSDPNNLLLSTENFTVG